MGLYDEPMDDDAATALGCVMLAAFAAVGFVVGLTVGWRFL